MVDRARLEFFLTMVRNYTEVKSNKSDTTKKIEIVSWIPFFRQTFVCTTLWTGYFMSGLFMGSPTVAVPQMRKEANSTDFVTDETASWIVASCYAAALLWMPFMPILAARFGRKKAFIVINISAIIYFTAFYFCSSPKEYLISQLFSGGLTASQFTVSLTALTEYSSPQYRGLFVTIKCASFTWGIWIANAIGTYFHWKKIGLLGIVCSIYVLVTNLVWPESPCWLAGQGRFDECIKSHRWLKGRDDMSERELESLLNTQKAYVNSRSRDGIRSVRGDIRDYFKTIKCKEYFRAMLIAFTTLSLYPFSGKLISTVYAIDIIKKITNNEATAYNYMLILDGFTVFSMYAGCILSRYIRRRTMLFFFTSAGILFLSSLSLYLCLIRFAIILDNKHVSLALLIGYSVTIGCGPMIMTTSICAEIAPLRFRGIFFFMCGLYYCLLFFFMFKVSPFFFKKIGLDGTFFLFAIFSSLFTCVLYKYLPETKDKNFKEIEENLKMKSPLMETKMEDLT